MNRIAIGAGALVVLVILGFVFPDLWPLVVIVGAVLIIVAVVAKPKSTELLPSARSGKSSMQLPEIWDERQITLGMDRYRGDKGLLGRYVDGIVNRFIMGQDMRTMGMRTQFLEGFNKYAAVARESYKWQRYLQGGRAALEEDLEDLRAEIRVQEARNELRGLQADPELFNLQRRMQRVETLLQIAHTEKAIADVNRPIPLPPPTPSAPSSAEIRKQKCVELEAREKNVREAIRLTEADPTLDEDLKQRRLNGLGEKLAQLHEEMTNLL